MLLARNLGQERRQVYIVCGLERGGTSMVAQALQNIGVFMGENLNATYEDAEIMHAVKAYAYANDEVSAAELRAVFESRSRKHERWGFKVPNIFLNPKVFEQVVDPLLVFVFRDPAAVSSHWMRAKKNFAIEEILQSVSHLQAMAIELWRTTKWPAVGFSYEKAILDPPTFIRDLASIVNDQVPRDRLLHAAECVKVSPPDYQRDASTQGAIAHADGLYGRVLQGWALDPSDELETLEVEIVIDNSVSVRMRADLVRDDLWEYCRSNFSHGFGWSLPASFFDGVEHEIELRVVGHPEARIGGSPLRFRMQGFGQLEEFVDASLCGWIALPNLDPNLCRVALHIDGAPVMAVPANQPREDLEAAGLPNARCFCFDLAPALLDGAVHKVEVVVEGINECGIAGNGRFVRFPSIGFH